MNTSRPKDNEVAVSDQQPETEIKENAPQKDDETVETTVSMDRQKSQKSSWLGQSVIGVGLSCSVLAIVLGIYLWTQVTSLNNRGAPAEISQMSLGLDKLSEDFSQAQKQLANLNGGFNELRELTESRIQTFNTRADGKFTQLEQKQAEELGQLKEKLAEARGTINELSQQMQTAMGNLQAEQTKFQGQIQASVDAMDQELRRSREQRILDEVDHYIVLSEQRIKIEKDAAAAAVSLEAALLRVKQLKRPAWQSLVKAMQEDIDKLKSVEAPNIHGFSQTLLDMQTGLAAIPLRGTDRHFEVRHSLPEMEKESGYLDRMWESVKSGLKMTVRIQKQGEPVTPLLSPEEGFFLYQNLRLKLEAARFALMRRDQNSFKESLSAASQWLGQYFSAQTKQSEQMLSNLKRLSESNIDPEIPGIENTRQLYREALAASSNTARESL